MKVYDRAAQSVGNIVHFEHVNVTQPDQRLATLFYVSALGGTRDPYLMPGIDNMWVNYGRTQVHLPTRAPQVLRGTVGLVVPDLDALKRRLQRSAEELARLLPGVETRFAWREANGAVEAVCPWGNRWRCHAPAPEFGPAELGIVYVDFDVPPGTAEGIARFYEEVMRAPAKCASGRAEVFVGGHQRLRFTETSSPIPEYDGHHIQVYIADFGSPYAWLKERGLITLETDANEWRFQWIVDPKDGRRLFQIEHEIRSMKHPLFARPLVNRNPAQTNTAYIPGQDAFRGTYY